MAYEQLDEHQVVVGLKALDTNVIDDFVERYSRSLFGVIRNYTKNPSDAEEILQDTLLKIIGKISTLRQESTIWPWMRKIAVNDGIMWLRKSHPRLGRTDPLDDLLAASSKDGPVYARSADPERLCLNSELAGELPVYRQGHPQREPDQHLQGRPDNVTNDSALADDPRTASPATEPDPS
jgi:RNA polymerase sigma factor (sigma-70 family)